MLREACQSPGIHRIGYPQPVGEWQGKRRAICAAPSGGVQVLLLDSRGSCALDRDRKTTVILVSISTPVSYSCQCGALPVLQRCAHPWHDTSTSLFTMLRKGVDLFAYGQLLSPCVNTVRASCGDVAV